MAGSGDIAPYVTDIDPLGTVLKGSLVGLLAVIALGALFITAEYRRGMIRTTFAASPRRGRVLAAKAIVIGLVTFAAGLAGAAVALPIAEKKLHSAGWASSVYPVWSLTSARGLQIVVGTAGLLAVAAILALSAGAVLRRTAGAIAAVVVLLIVPLILGFILPQRTRGLAAAAHPGRGVRAAAGHTALLAGDQRLRADQRLFSAGTVGRVCRAVRLGRGRAGDRRVPAAPEGCMNATA